MKQFLINIQFYAQKIMQITPVKVVLYYGVSVIFLHYCIICPMRDEIRIIEDISINIKFVASHPAVTCATPVTSN